MRISNAASLKDIQKVSEDDSTLPVYLSLLVYGAREPGTTGCCRCPLYYTGPFLGSAENKSPSGDGVLYALALVLSGGGTVVKSEEVIC